MCVFRYSLGLKVPAIVKEARAALDRGHCVVIGLQTTGEVSTIVSAHIAALHCTTETEPCHIVALSPHTFSYTNGKGVIGLELHY